MGALPIDDLDKNANGIKRSCSTAASTMPRLTDDVRWVPETLIGDGSIPIEDAKYWH
jgi:hypothetical protein